MNRGRRAAAMGTLLAIGMLAGCGGGEPKLSVTDAELMEPMNPDVVAVYFTLTNKGGADTLTGVEALDGGEASLHLSSRNDDGTTMMAPVDSIDVPEDSTVEFHSGGYHVMVEQPGEVVAGDTLSLKLSFETSAPITVDAAVVESLGEDDHDH